MRPNEIFERLNKNATCQNKDFLITKSRSQADFFFQSPVRPGKRPKSGGAGMRSAGNRVATMIQKDQGGRESYVFQMRTDLGREKPS